MKMLRLILPIFLIIVCVVVVHSQDNSTLPQRTPEQEAIKQTEKLQQELNLTVDQTKQIYEINLRYARERQISNTRSEAVERMKNKNSDIQRVLNTDQKDKLQSKRYERTSSDAPPVINRSQPILSSGFNSQTDNRNVPNVRVNANDATMRSSYRPTQNVAQPTVQPNVQQSVRRSVSSPNSQSVSVPSAVRSIAPQAPMAAPASNNSSNRSSNPTRTEPTSNSNRR